MNYDEIDSKIEFETGANTTTYPNAQRVLAINEWIYKIETMILDSQDDWDIDDSNNTNYPIATTNLVAGQRDYTFPVTLGITQIKRVDVTYDGVTWVKCTEMDSSMIKDNIGNDDYVDNTFSTAQPYYDMKSNAIWLYPRPTSNVSNGLRIEYFRDFNIIDADDLSSTSLEPGFDRAFHPMIAYGAAADWLMAKSKSNPSLMSSANYCLSKMQDYEVRLRKYYGRKNLDEQVIASSQYISYK